MEVPLSPGAILRRGRRAIGREHGLIERIDIVNTKDCAAPPGREIARREAQINEGSPRLEGTEARLWPAIDQREAELTIESNGLGHGPYSEGHGTDVVDHRHGVCSDERLLFPGLHAWPDLRGHGLHITRIPGAPLSSTISHVVRTHVSDQRGVSPCHLGQGILPSEPFHCQHHFALLARAPMLQANPRWQGALDASLKGKAVREGAPH
jgi:hypothetical protein